MRSFLPVLMVLGVTVSTFADPPMTAVSSQPVHPVLLRNEHGPLTRVVVMVENRRRTNKNRERPDRPRLVGPK